MKYFILFLLFVPVIAIAQVKPQDQTPWKVWATDREPTKCDKTHHYYVSTALTFPPCYDCECGRHLNFGLKTYMALETKYGDTLYCVVEKYMSSGAWYRGEKILDSVAIEKLAGDRYRRYLNYFDSLRKNSKIIEAPGETVYPKIDKKAKNGQE